MSSLLCFGSSKPSLTSVIWSSKPSLTSVIRSSKLSLTSVIRSSKLSLMSVIHCTLYPSKSKEVTSQEVVNLDTDVPHTHTTEDQSVQTHQSIVHSLLTYRAYDSTSSEKIKVEITYTDYELGRRAIRIIGLFFENRLHRKFNPLNPELNPICYFWHY